MTVSKSILNFSIFLSAYTTCRTAALRTTHSSMDATPQPRSPQQPVSSHSRPVTVLCPPPAVSGTRWTSSKEHASWRSWWRSKWSRTNRSPDPAVSTWTDRPRGCPSSRHPVVSPHWPFLDPLWPCLVDWDSKIFHHLYSTLFHLSYIMLRYSVTFETITIYTLWMLFRVPSQ